MSDISFKYKYCEFELRLYKKNFLGQKKLKYVYCTQDTIIINRHPYQKIPDKIIELKPDWKVEWIYDQKKENEPFENKVNGFKLLTDNSKDNYEYYGDSLEMITMKSYLQRQLFQINFLEEFQLIRKLGQGKYAKVYEVKRLDNKKIYAVKYLSKEKLATVEDSQKFLQNELKILRMLNHPNCIKIYETYEDEHGYYILQELLDSSKSLQCELTKFQNPQFGYQVIRKIMQEMLKGLEYVHSLGIMHRDLKPQNIMFSQKQTVKVIDFGLAQFYNEKKYLYVHVGTPGFVAPEILANESEFHTYTPKVDSFSLGVVFHILLTGKTIFKGQRYSQVLENNKKCNVQFPEKIYDELNQDAKDLLNKLLDPNPETRISTSEALRHNFIIGQTYKEITKMVSAVNLDQIQDFSLKDNKTKNKNEIQSLRDLDDQVSYKFQTNFVNLQEINNQMGNVEGILFTQSKKQSQYLYKLTKDIVDLIIFFEENYEKDELFFISPIKTTQNKKNIFDGKNLQSSHLKTFKLQKIQEENEEYISKF
ncbi:protein kinase domain protein [Ichthyophthirius multifiliis]|uniref:non-specific serine/threonine protein kinase n=1 Tax=Ichthyophthirius multifiliis TaxID=5932 RepID=G0QKK1_ICHMU|nr:protein kinase domain protein [Ichthyophthirius multifiliis]EGR34252.1 protein kinase domain protein [Ichthyophthirius multifiliis]|eukprot:XP_004039556.1 protein kinase domain protein [Ichthyophthirius multifiliis]